MTKPIDQFSSDRLYKFYQEKLKQEKEDVKLFLDKKISHIPETKLKKIIELNNKIEENNDVEFSLKIKIPVSFDVQVCGLSTDSISWFVIDNIEYIAEKQIDSEIRKTPQYKNIEKLEREFKKLLSAYCKQYKVSNRLLKNYLDTKFEV